MTNDSIGQNERVPHKALGDLCDPERGITYGIVKVGDYVAGGVRVVRGGDIRDGRIIFDDEKRVTEEVSQQYRRTILRGGEILVNLIAEPGHTAIVSPDLAGANVSRDVAVIPLNDNVEHEYVDYFLKSHKAIEWLSARLQGSVTQKINIGTLRDLPVPLPPRSEQRIIARILRTFDDKIDLLRRMNQTIERICGVLFQSWFVDFDPVRAKAARRNPTGMDAETAKLFPSALSEVEGLPVPKGWALQTMYDCAQYINGAAYRDFGFSPDRSGLPVIKIAELKAGVTAQTRFTLTDMGDRYRIDTGDILFSWSGNPDTSIDTFVWTGGPAWLNQHIFKVVTKDRAHKIFVYYLLRRLRPDFAEIARNKQTTGLGHVTVQDMKCLQVVVPPTLLLAAFEKHAGALFDRYFSNLQMSSTLAETRDALLQKLLSGALRAPDFQSEGDGYV